MAWALEAVGLSHVRPRTTRTLSGGELQRLAIAAVLAMGPRLLVLDEPMANLDLDGTGALIDAIGKLNRDEGVTCVVVEHRLGPAAAIAGRTVVLERGEVAADGPTGEVLNDEALLDRLGLRGPSSARTAALAGTGRAGPGARRRAGGRAARGHRGRGQATGADATSTSPYGAASSSRSSGTTAPARAPWRAWSPVC